jgi:hypothetical protein
VRYADHGGVGQLRVGDQRWQSHRLGLKSHRKVVDLIDAGDVEGAVSPSRLHLTHATWTNEAEGERIADALGGYARTSNIAPASG